MSKFVRKLSESVNSADENRSDSKIEKEHKRKSSTSLQTEGTQQDAEPQDSKSQSDRAEATPEEPQKQKNAIKNEKHVKKDETESQSFRSVPKKESRSSKEKNEKERSVSEEKSLLKHKYKGDGIHKTGDDSENTLSERGMKNEDSIHKYSQTAKTLSDEKSEKKNKHRSEKKISVNSKDVKTASEHVFRTEESSRKENRKDRQGSVDKARTEHKSKKSSCDSRLPKESQNVSKQHNSVTLKRSESHTEEKREAESMNVDCTLKQGDNVHKERRRSKSGLDDRVLLKSKSKSHSKQSRVPETEVQESSSRQESGHKLDRNKHAEESDPDKLLKSKTAVKVSTENSLELDVESSVHSVSSSQKDCTPKVKLQAGDKSFSKERTKVDKDLSSARLERKLSTEAHKSRSLKHSNKEMKKREEENKPEDKGVKPVDSHSRLQENNMLVDKKSVKKLSSDNRKASMSIQETDVGEEKLPAVTTAVHCFSGLQNTIWTSTHSLHSEISQEPVEVSLEQRPSNTQHHQIPKVPEEENSNSQGDTKFKYKEDQMQHNSMHELNKTLHTKETSKSSFSSLCNPLQKFENAPMKELDAPTVAFTQALKDMGSTEKETNVISDHKTSEMILLEISCKEDEKLKLQQETETAQISKNLQNVVDSNKDIVSHMKNSLKESACNQKTMDKCVAKDDPFDFDSLFIKGIISNREVHIVNMEQHDSIELDNNIQEGSITNLEVNRDVTMPLSCKETNEENVSAFADMQETTVQEAESGIIKNDSPIEPDMSTSESILSSLKEKERDNLSKGSFSKKDRVSSDCKDKTKENHSASAGVGSSVFVPKNIPEHRSKLSMMVSEGRGNDVRMVAEDKNESNIVGSTCVSIGNSTEPDAIVIGTSSEKTSGRTATATSTGESLGEGSRPIHLQREGDAIISCSEEKSATPLICASIEADEGLTGGPWMTNKEDAHSITEKLFGECTVTATEESSGVTEGLAVCESSSTSTKDEESGECTVNYIEENSKQLINESGLVLEQSVNRIIIEEKDDAVTSAGSEERRMATACSGTINFNITAVCVSEVESDGAVTSAGTGGQDESVTTENADESQNSATGTEHVKATEGTVTCTGIGRGSTSSAVCSVSGTDSQKHSVTRICAEMANNSGAGPHADKSEDIVNGESAVTSTGIIAEDDPEGASACTGLEDSNEGFAVALDTQEKYDMSTDSKKTRAQINLIEVSQGPYDDEGCVTSTGAKEDDEEGENFVTSTGRGNEEAEQVLACIGAEESERAVESRGSSICLTADQLRTELSECASAIDKGTVDSRTDLEKEVNIDPHNTNSIKEVVESSTTSHETGSENVLVFAEGESLFAEKGKCDISATSEQEITQHFAMEENSENGTSGVVSRKCETLFQMVPEKADTPSASANKDEKEEGDTISTSASKVALTSEYYSSEHSEQTSPVARATESLEKTTRIIGLEDFSTPMSSTAVEYMDLDEAGNKSNKVSTSVLEECEAPLSDARMEENENVSAQAVNVTTDIDTCAMPISSIPAEESCMVLGKEESDECTVISTSITEDSEASVSQEGAEDKDKHFTIRAEQAVDTISTSSGEHSETSVFPAEAQQGNQVSRTERKLETFAISTMKAAPKEGDEDFKMHRTEDLMSFQEARSQKFDLVAQSTEKSNESSIAWTEKREKFDLFELGDANTKPDQQVATLNTENPEDSGKTSTRIEEECDSVSVVVVSEDASLSFASKDVQTERNSVICSKEFDCTISSTPENKENSLTEFHTEEQKLHHGGPDGALEESATSKIKNDAESTEISASIIRTASAEEDFCTKICSDSSPSDGPLTEASINSHTYQEDEQHKEIASDFPLDQKSGEQNLAINCINSKPVSALPKTRDISDGSSASLLFELDKTEDEAFCSEADLCRQCNMSDIHGAMSDPAESEVSSQRSAAYKSDTEGMLSVVTEEPEQRTEETAIKESRCKSLGTENLHEKIWPEEIPKALETSDTSIVTEAVEAQVSAEKLLELQVEIPDKKEESFMPETDRNPTAEEDESDKGQVSQILEVEAEQNQYHEAKSEINTVFFF
uniref:Uncharacterized protein n=1 Tax=Salvator merianae TaxID=96440 RepID=A0A8D0EF97_SALMN